MPVTAIVQITTQLLAADPPKDFMTCTLHYQSDLATVADADFQNMANTTKTIWFATGGAYQHYGTNGGYVNVYNLADPHPRPQRGHASYTPTTWATDVSYPRQICLCVSFYSQRNIKRNRGRIYTPTNPAWGGTGGRPSQAVRDQGISLLKTLGQNLRTQTPVWFHVVYSPTDASSKTVTNYWCNDVWDIQRRRAPKETTRSLGVP
jgi:hypothetical protein